MKKIDGILNKTDKTKAKNEKTIQQIAHRRCGVICPHWIKDDARCEFLAVHTRIKVIECIRFQKEHPLLKTLLKCPNCRMFIGTKFIKDIREKSLRLMCPKCGYEANAISFIATDD